jgi:hypothetical protein
MARRGRDGLGGGKGGSAAGGGALIVLVERREVLLGIFVLPELIPRMAPRHAGQSQSARRQLNPQTLEAYRDPSDPMMIRLPDGLFECSGLELASYTKLIGAGQGRTILRSSRNANVPVLRNSDLQAGNRGIEIRALTIDGAAEDQLRTSNGVQMERVSDCYFEIEIKNCFGTGFLLAGGGRNRFGREMYCHGNGRRGAGYGLYIFGSSDNLVQGGRYDDNCIGVAVEASRKGVVAYRNRLVDVRCIGNRADFGQSGAGIHFEQTEGGDCDGGMLINPTCTKSTGVGINNTGCALTIRGGHCSNNREAGIVTIAASGFHYSGVNCTNNALGTSSGYRSEMRFDDSGLRPASSGLVSNCRLTGAAPDGGIRTMSKYSAIRFVKNVVKGYRFPYILSSAADKAT